MATRQVTRQCEQCGRMFTLLIFGRVVPPGRGRFCDRRCAAQRWRRGSDQDRFWRNVNKSGPAPSYRLDLGPCWLWTASTIKGYGQFHLHDSGDKCTAAHNWAYQNLIGPVPSGLELDHLCRVRRCVNPSHLEPVTRQTNCIRGARWNNALAE